jgi:hypothetical protein
MSMRVVPRCVCLCLLAGSVLGARGPVGPALALNAQEYFEGRGVSVPLPSPLPDALEGRAGLNIEFLPSAYFGTSYIAGQRTGVFPSPPGRADDHTWFQNPFSRRVQVASRRC